MKLCECGCGQYTSLARQTDHRRGWIKGQSVRFMRGHTAARLDQRGRPYFKPSENRWSISDRNGNNVRWARIVLEHKLNRLLSVNEVAHHINNNSTDDSPDNLVAVTRAEHNQIHHSI